jgi:Animal haem peroxidase
MSRNSISGPPRGRLTLVCRATRRLVPTALAALVLVSAFGAAAAHAECTPDSRPLDGSCNNPLDLGRAGTGFLRVDGPEAPSPSAPRARELSNQFLAQDPFPGIELFETTLIPFESLRLGQHPQQAGGYRLNQLAVAFGQAVTHDLTKARTAISPAAINAPDYQYASDDPLCQKIAETSPTTIYYFPCEADIRANGDGTSTVSLSNNTRYTFIVGTSWTYRNGPTSVTVPTSKVTHRKSTLPLAAALVPDDSGTSQVPLNAVTSFLDLSLVYGNSDAINSVIRAKDGTGMLRTADDGDIPFGPGVPNDCGAFDPVDHPLSASGDSRVDESLFLDVVHSLYFRNHNRDAAWVAANHPELSTDEQRFQRARAINIARFQQQVYNELLPAVFGPQPVRRYLGGYQGYDSTVDPRISSTFDMALRVAHGQVFLPPFVLDSTGAPVEIEGILGFPSHSNPNCLFTTFRHVGGRAVALSAMSQAAQAVTGRVSDLMRNLVFRTANNQNTAGFNIDIEQLNIIRGREFQIPNFDALRRHWRGSSVYGLPGCNRAAEAHADPLACFKYVSKEKRVYEKLREVYRHVDRIDAFIGLMLESNDDDAGQFRFPPTATIVILDQLRKTRTADRWFYLNADNPHLDFSPAELARINETVGQSLEASYGLTGIGDAFLLR